MRHLVPTFILERFDHGEQQGKLFAATMFADLSGFSKMSDVLAKQMRYVSDELLASVMQAVFAPLVQDVYVQGGFVVGYAGDAITAVFLPDPADAALDIAEACARRCLSAALAIQNHFAQHPTQSTPLGDFPVSVKIGLSLGEVTWEIFRSVNQSKATFGFRGAAIDASAHAEHCAKPGETWLDRPFYQAVKSRIYGELAGEFFHLSRSEAALPGLALPVLDIPAARHIAAFFPPAIVNSPFMGEFRPLVNVFIDLPTDPRLSSDAPGGEPADQVAELMRAVFELQDRYGGFFLRPDFGDKGANLLIFWGAPVAYENDIERALNFLLELRHERKILFTAGVSYRHQYAGFIGSALREDYTGYGWGISLAARMMKSAAPGEIWVDGEVAQRIEADFHLDKPEERQFKGFAEKQRVYRLFSRKDMAEQVFRGAFEGREQELTLLKEFVAPLWRGQPAGRLLIKGDAGVGKSRLVHEFMDSPLFADGQVVWAICQTDEIIRQPFNPFRYWLKNWAGLANAASVEDPRDIFFCRINQLVSITPDEELRAELLRTNSVLGALLNLTWEDSLYEHLDAKGRYENTFIALSVLLRCESLRNPLILLIEDAHWLDQDSRAFLPYFTRSLHLDISCPYPIAILATSRLEGEAFPFLGNFPARELTLKGLERRSLEQMALELLGAPVSGALVDFLAQRADGNPFFVEQALRYLQENKLLEQQNGLFNIIHSDQVDLLSTDIQSLLVARLDQLKQEVKNVVQSAAVLGREFEVRLLSKMLDDTLISSAISQAETAEIWMPRTDAHYSFQHALMRDAAYSMQLRARQRELHTLAVVSIEQLYAGDLSIHYDELAYHAERASLNEKARVYLRLAGDAARDYFENAQAEDYYTRALKRTPETDLEGRYQLLLARENVLTIAGKREAVLQDIEQLQAIAAALRDEAKMATARVRRANSLQTGGEYAQVVHLMDAVFESAHARGDDVISLQAAGLLAQASVRLGHYSQAVAYCEQGLVIARREQNRGVEAGLLNTLGMIMLEEQNLPASIRYFEQALSIFKETSNLAKLAMPLSNLGMVAGQMGNFDAAWGYYEEALQLTQKVGQRRGEAIVLVNLGWVASMLGAYGRARVYLERTLYLTREINDRFVETNALINLSSCASALGDAEAALLYTRQALELARQSGDQNSEAWALTFMGHSLWEKGELAQAVRVYRSALAIRRSFNQPALAAEPGAGLARVLLAQGDLNEAKQHTNDILDYLASGGALDGADEPARVYLNCFLTLSAARDDRAAQMLRAGCAQLKARAASITDEIARRNFFEQVSYNRELLTAWKAAGMEEI